MKKRLATILSLVIIIVVVVSAFVVIDSFRLAGPVASKKPFYVGVTYCGDNVTEAEQLIDKVKSYTNLLVLQSGPLIEDINATEQICSYAVKAGLEIILYCSFDYSNWTCASLLNIPQACGGDHFLGLYYNDETGGKMLDEEFPFYNHNANVLVTKMPDGSLNVEYLSNNTMFVFYPSGEISEQCFQSSPNSSSSQTYLYFSNGTISYTTSNSISEGTSWRTISQTLIYQPNGTVTDNGTVVTDAGNILQFEPYREVWDSRPLATYAEVASAYVNADQYMFGSIGNQTAVKLFTSDYALYWFDYRAGYDTVFAELFGRQTDAQTLALVRGASDMQGKSWGVMIEPASQSPLSMQTGTQMYNEMKQAYEDGAEYAVAFNYSPDNNATGLLQKQQFAALQKFWKDIVQNHQVTNNVMGKAALVLPSDYGWGMRNQNDTIWGMWQPDNESQQVWNAVQTSLHKYGSKLDIIYDDPAYPVGDRYQHVYYWNQTI